MKSFAWSAAFMFAAAVAAGAQDIPTRCNFIFPNTPSTRAVFSTEPGGARNTFIGGGVVANCEGQNNELRADSAEYYADQGYLLLIGAVRYREPRATVNSDRMTYYEVDQRLHAEGNVVAVLANGTTLRGPVADYYRAILPLRSVARLVASGRPRLKLVQEDSAGRPLPDTTTVVANVLTTDGDSVVYAGGQVDITRPGLHARGDSAFLDNQREFARLMVKPTVENSRNRPFTLSGGVIDLYSRSRQLERVVATPDGHVLSTDLELVADSVDMRLADGQLRQVFAWGKRRARALSPEREILADSITATLFAQRVREVRAHRNAYLSSVPDTARILSEERDWMMGDTLIARFDTAAVAATDSARRATLREVLSIGAARSYYQLSGSGALKTPPTINYVRGRTITASFRDGRLGTVTVTESAGGVVLEPVVRTPPAAAAPARPSVSAPAPAIDRPRR